MARPGTRLRRRVAIVVGLLMVLLLAGGQLLLPAVAVRVARHEIDDPRATVEIRAFPAVKLLWGRVDRLRMTSPTLDADPQQLTDLLRRARHVRQGTIRVGELRMERVRLRAVRATIDQGTVSASAELRISELEAQVPAGGTLTAEPPQPDGLPRLRATIAVLGFRTSVPIVVRAVDGVLEASGDSGITSVVRIPVFANEALHVDDVRGTVAGDTLRIRFRGHLR